MNTLKNKLKVVLVVPNFYWVDSDQNALWEYLPYNLCLLAAMIEAKCEVSILDAYGLRMSKEEFRSSIEKLKPDIVGITVLMDQYAKSGHGAAEIVKSINKDIKVVLGGVYATMNPERAMADKNIDYLVMGEGEYVLRDLIDYFIDGAFLPSKGICYRSNGKIVNLGRSDFIQDLDSIPLPAYHLIDFEKFTNRVSDRKSVDVPRKYPYTRIITSRGCPIGCCFCQVCCISGTKFRARSVKNILAEIRWLKEKYHIQSFVFDDDNLFTDRKRVGELFQGMIDEKLVMPWSAIATAVFKLDKGLIKLMRKSGCEYIDVAVESGNERILKEIIKKPVDYEQAKEMIHFAREQGIFVAANFIVGFPTETWSEIRKTVKAAEEIGADYIKLFVAIPLPHTRLWDLSVKTGAFKKDYKDAHRVWTLGQLLETDEFYANDLTILRAYEWDRINFSDPIKTKRIAEMMGITVEELAVIRRRTLRDACEKVKGS